MNVNVEAPRIEREKNLISDDDLTCALFCIEKEPTEKLRFEKIKALIFSQFEATKELVGMVELQKRCIQEFKDSEEALKQRINAIVQNHEGLKEKFQAMSQENSHLKKKITSMEREYTQLKYDYDTLGEKVQKDLDKLLEENSRIQKCFDEATIRVSASEKKLKESLENGTEPYIAERSNTRRAIETIVGIALIAFGLWR